MKYFRNTSLLCMLLLFWGCNNPLNPKPQQSISQNIALNTSDNVKKVLIGAYTTLGAGSQYGGLMYLLPDLLAADHDMQWKGTFTGEGQIFNDKILIDNGAVTGTWEDGYNTINIVNNVLSKLNVVDKADRDRVEGEAKFIRAITYFQLVRLFGKDYNDGDPTKNMGVPLKLTPTKKLGKSQEIPRNVVQKVYSKVIEDLKSTESLLKEHPSSYVYASKYAASAFLARVYMQQGAYAKARDEADKVIEKGPYSLVKNFADEFNNSNVNTSEDIFAIQVTKQRGTNSLQNFYASKSNGGRGDIDILKDHLNLYKKGDDRLKLFYKGGGFYRTGKWKNQYGDIPVIRLAEMYLDRAECNFRLGTAVGAVPIQDINTIRKRVGLKDISSVTLGDILAQRHIELAFEGHFLFDLKRTKGTVNGISWDSPRLVFPIPQREIRINPKLKQNEGYGK